MLLADIINGIMYFTWSGFIPVKQNIPICSVICSQFRVEPSFINPSLSFCRIVIMRSAIPLTSSSLKISNVKNFNLMRTFWRNPRKEDPLPVNVEYCHNCYNDYLDVLY